MSFSEVKEDVKSAQNMQIGMLMMMGYNFPIITETDETLVFEYNHPGNSAQEIGAHKMTIIYSAD